MRHINYPKYRKSPKPFTKEHLSKISASNKISVKKLWENPEYREKNRLSHLGHKAWNKGKSGYTTSRRGYKTPESTKEKIRKTMKDKGIMPLTDKRATGERNSKWKGGITPLNEKIRKSRDYVIWRTAVFMRDNYTCQSCGEKGGQLNAEHIKPFSLFPELRFAIDNGKTLCESCHKETFSYLNNTMKREDFIYVSIS